MCKKEDFIQFASLEEFGEWRDQMAEDDKNTYHEVIQGRVRPYFDFEQDFATKAEFDKQRATIMYAAQDEIRRQYPKGEVISLDSSGKKLDGTWRVSGRFFVCGAGYYTDPADVKPIAQRLRTPGFDLGVYHNQKTMRLAYCHKEGEPNRILKRCDIQEAKILLLDEDKTEDLLGETFCDWLVGDYLKKEKKCLSKEQVKEEKKGEKADDDDEDKGDKEDKEDSWKGWTFEKAKSVIDRLHNERAKTHKERVDGICSILHLAKAIRKTANFRELAHLFAKKDPEYSEADTDRDYDYFKKTPEKGKPRTFASLIKFANEDSPLPKAVKLDENVDISLTNYDDLYQLMAENPALEDIQKYLLGCLRFCNRNGKEDWFQHSTDGWHRIENKSNFPFATKSSNMKYGDTNLQEITEKLKDTVVFRKRCMVDGVEFYPWYGENDRPKIINIFNGWPWKLQSTNIDELEASYGVRQFKAQINNLFGKEPGEYVLNTLTRKLLFPREKGKLIMAYDKFGGGGKNNLENILSRVFGEEHCISSAGTKEILGQGEAGFNPLAEKCLIAFIQEAKEGGKSIVCDEKLKNWLTSDKQIIRPLGKGPFKAPNYGSAFMWTNNKDALKLTPAMSRRVMAVEIGYDMSDDSKPEVAAYHTANVELAKNEEEIQNIFDWLIQRDISNFDLNIIPQTTFKTEMAEASMTYVQKYIVDLCNGGQDEIEVKKGIAKVWDDELFTNYRSWCTNDQRLADKFTLTKEQFYSEIKSKLGLEKKRMKEKGRIGYGFRIVLTEVEAAMRLLLKNNAWVLLKPVEEAPEESDEE